jgi:nitrogen fixation protein FixH
MLSKGTLHYIEPYIPHGGGGHMNKKQFTVIIVITILCSFFGGIVAVGIFQGTPVHAQKQLSLNVKEFKLPEGHFIGFVKEAKCYLIVPKPAFSFPVRLTGISMQEARPAENSEIELSQYEGKTLMIKGHDGGSWIYRAQVIDSGGPLMTALVNKVFIK